MKDTLEREMVQVNNYIKRHGKIRLSQEGCVIG